MLLMLLLALLLLALLLLVLRVLALGLQTVPGLLPPLSGLLLVLL